MKLNPTILVLDDEPLIRLMVCSQLEKSGALVSEASCCADALALARNSEVDAALFDCRLPDGDGLDVARQLRKEGFVFPIAMLSAESIDIEEEVVENLGICAVFSKPPDVVKIVQTLEQEMGRAVVHQVERVGRYAYWRVDPDCIDVPVGWSDHDWLAADLSEWPSGCLPPILLEAFCVPRCGLAIVGASLALRGCVERLGLNVDFMGSVEELAALSRRPSSPQERAALLGAVQMRVNGEPCAE